MKVAINRCFGGFGLSQAAYEKLIEWGVPVKKYINEKRDPVTLRYRPEPRNDGEVIFDRELTPPETDSFSALYWQYKDTSGSLGRYWDVWTDNRTHPLVIRVIEELGDKANGPHARLAIVYVPDGTDYAIEEYDGKEHIAERHRTWS